MGQQKDDGWQQKLNTEDKKAVDQSKEILSQPSPKDNTKKSTFHFIVSSIDTLGPTVHDVTFFFF